MRLATPLTPATCSKHTNETPIAAKRMQDRTMRRHGPAPPPDFFSCSESILRLPTCTPTTDSASTAIIRHTITHNRQLFFVPLLVLLYRAWKWIEPYDPEYNHHAGHAADGDGGVHNDDDDPSFVLSPDTVYMRPRDVLWTMEQQPSYFVQNHPCFPYLKSGLVLTALDMLHTLPCTTHVDTQHMLTIYHGGCTAGAGNDPCGAPWVWALRMMDETRLLCVYGDADDSRMPWYPSNDVVTSTRAVGLIVRRRTPHAHHKVDLSIVVDVTDVGQLRQALLACREGGVLIVHHSTDNLCIDELLFVLGTCFERSHVHVSNYVAVTTSCHRVWMGLGRRRHSPMAQCILNWLERLHVHRTQIETLDWSAIRSVSFAAWKSFVHLTMRQHASRRFTAPRIGDTCAEDFFHASVSAAVWTQVSEQSTYGTHQLHDDNDECVDQPHHDSMIRLVRNMKSVWFPSVSVPLGCGASTNHNMTPHTMLRRWLYEPIMVTMSVPTTTTMTTVPTFPWLTVASTYSPRLALLIQESAWEATWSIHTWKGASTHESGTLPCSLPLGAAFVALVTTDAFLLVDLIRLAPFQDSSSLSFTERQTRLACMLAHGTDNVVIRGFTTHLSQQQQQQQQQQTPHQSSTTQHWHVRYRQ